MENNYYKNNKQLIETIKNNNSKEKCIRLQKYNSTRLENIIQEVGKVLTTTLHIQPKSSINDYYKLAQSINAVNKYNKENKEEQDEFSKLFQKMNTNFKKSKLVYKRVLTFLFFIVQ